MEAARDVRGRRGYEGYSQQTRRRGGKWSTHLVCRVPVRARCVQRGRGRRPKGERYLYSPAGLTRRLPRDILIVGLHGAGRCGTFLLPSFTRAAAACLRLETSCLFSRKIEQGDASVTQRCSTFRTMLEDCRGLFTACPYPSCQSWYGYWGQFALATARPIDGETARLRGFRSNKIGARR